MAQGKKTPVVARAARRATPRAARVVNNGHFRVRVRMYRQGLGDCFLVTLPRDDGSPFYLMIDCGVILGTPDAAKKMTDVVDDIAHTTGGRLDVLAATHEHWDHLSGFVQAKAAFSKLKVDQVWLAWTEDPDDSLARTLRAEHTALRTALTAAVNHMRLTGSAGEVDDVADLLGLFGAQQSGTTTDALNEVKRLAAPRYCRPTDPPISLENVSARVYVLGPPHDEKMIHKYNPSKSQPETYGLAAADVFLAGAGAALLDADATAPFDVPCRIPTQAARQIGFFQTHYWGEDRESSERDQGWRRIDDAWLDASSNLALQLDSATNNTCLVLAIELSGGDVLIFAADAQVGNWLSWQDLSWSVDGHRVTGPDLLRRAIFYKVGHHGSHNATLKEKGLELMASLKVAMIPVDHEMAVKKRWGKMPLPALVTRLDEITKGGVLRIDGSVPQSLARQIKSTPLFYEIEF